MCTPTATTTPTTSATAATNPRSTATCTPRHAKLRSLVRTLSVETASCSSLCIECRGFELLFAGQFVFHAVFSKLFFSHYFALLLLVVSAYNNILLACDCSPSGISSDFPANCAASVCSAGNRVSCLVVWIPALIMWFLRERDKLRL